MTTGGGGTRTPRQRGNVLATHHPTCKLASRPPAGRCPSVRGRRVPGCLRVRRALSRLDVRVRWRPREHPRVRPGHRAFHGLCARSNRATVISHCVRPWAAGTGKVASPPVGGRPLRSASTAPTLIAQGDPVHCSRGLRSWRRCVRTRQRRSGHLPAWPRLRRAPSVAVPAAPARCSLERTRGRAPRPWAGIALTFDHTTQRHASTAPTRHGGGAAVRADAVTSLFVAPPQPTLRTRAATRPGQRQRFAPSGGDLCAHLRLREKGTILDSGGTVHAQEHNTGSRGH